MWVNYFYNAPISQQMGQTLHMGFRLVYLDLTLVKVMHISTANIIKIDGQIFLLKITSNVGSRMAYLYLTLAYSKGQDQGYVHFDCYLSLKW